MSSSDSKNSRKDFVWKYMIEVSGEQYLRCKFCNQRCTGGVNRLKHHLAGTHHGMKPCSKVKFEGINGGMWLSITERSRGFVVSLGFGEEELDWLLEHLKKAVELEASGGFTRKIRGKTRTHLMEICFNSRGRFMKITEIVAKRKSLVLVVPEGVKGNGWETLRMAISRVQDVSDQAVRASKEKDKESQVSKGMYREGRSYAEVVAEKGHRTELRCQLEDGKEL
ncbi:hypothetical protein CK203_044714 [Vitis vinifera]|uniref:BED-type domain-containing protein n=1 Tax=Vitis vinifera TaxID=29760 RepID=A0A438H9A5_VITVI|nr:hypothetical protein CK203_044714 [Vitis vinifera]